MRNIGKNIRYFRLKKGWSQKDLAGKLKISSAALSKIESGISDINASRLHQFAVIFGVSNIILFFEENLENQGLDYDAQINELKDCLKERDQRIMFLQKKLIESYEGSC